MVRFELFNHRQICSLALSTMLVFTLCSSAGAKKDNDRNPHAPYVSSTVIEVPVVIAPGKADKKNKTYKSHKKGYIPSRGRVDKMSPQRPQKKRNDYKNKSWKRWDRVYGRSPWKSNHRPRYGSIHRSLPRDHFSLFLGGVPFFYSAGVYFQSSKQGYVVVQPPIGGRVQILPEGCSYFYYGGRRHYSCDDVFYEERGAEYVVINRPSSYRIIADPGDEVEIDANSLNLRSGPGLRYETLTVLHQGEIAEVDAVDGEWYYVSLEDGSYGWIKRQYTRIISFKEDPKG
ncbi:DUF6515 family protein [Desulforhopalus sp. IMCC35007]|uniref:DUF6515 family protein n=1 Tax=Desulforhopalus sp. IMCC35007 TaxID=2569543 RepID=UPI0010AE3404|nr:DUF6515 family protein [Desulforhopalus sp. IMCC35007]TKB06213.1 SH3 domain-containing protein [Desulforhopalus sp. IMCC35007]